MIGDKGFMHPGFQEELKINGLYLQTPLRNNMKDDRPEGFFYDRHRLFYREMEK